MYKRWFLGMVLLCISACTLSIIWMVSPQTLAENGPYTNTQTQDTYLLIDIGGYLNIVSYSNEADASTLEQTDILVNLLPEQDALRIKAGYLIASSDALEQTLDALRSAQTS